MLCPQCAAARALGETPEQVSGPQGCTHPLRPTQNAAVEHPFSTCTTETFLFKTYPLRLDLIQQLTLDLILDLI